MLKKIRVILAALFFVAITLLFLDFTGTLHHYLGWLAKIQFLPALLALNAVVIAALVILTLVFGRIYCSVICPLGVFQDVVAWIHGRSKRNRYSYSKAKSVLRYTVLALFVLAFVLGVNSLVALLAPYSSYGRMVTHVLQPLYLWANNGLALLAERADSYAFYSVDVWLKSLPTLVAVILTFGAIIVLAWRNGRTYCNTICPVGTILSFLARFSLLKITMDREKCVQCSLCSKNCKAACIDYKNYSIDYTRCVVCGNCIGKCKKAAISYTHPKTQKATAHEMAKSADSGKRAFLLGTAIASGTAMMAQANKKVDGGLAVIEDKIAPERKTPLTPPGSLSAQNMAKHCTACQLCVAACPNGVLRPSVDLLKFMQPTMSYERGYCRPECTRCSEVCPAGAIRPIDKGDKSSTQIGHAVWIPKNCVVLTDDVACGNCARHCPAGAITMLPSDKLKTKSGNSAIIPIVNTERCIGCGACENVCPSRPFSAIYVEGHEVHRTI